MDPDLVHQQHEEEKLSHLRALQKASADVLAPSLSPSSKIKRDTVVHIPDAEMKIIAEEQPASTLPIIQESIVQPPHSIHLKSSVLQKTAANLLLFAASSFTSAVAAIAYTEYSAVPIGKARILILGAALYGGLSTLFIARRHRRS